MTVRRPLPLLDLKVRHGSRSLMTCKYRCGNACDHAEPNTSGNPRIGEILERTISRRRVLQNGAAAGAATLLVTSAGGSIAAAAVSGGAATASMGPVLDFMPVPQNRRDNVRVPRGFDYDVVARWGDRVVPGAPRFDAYDQSADAQSQQFGYNCDYIGVVAIPGETDRMIMAVNHEYTNEELMFPEGRYTDKQIKRIAIQAHGMSVIEIERARTDGAWKRVAAGRTTYNRRITGTTEMRLTGPAAGHRRLRTAADPAGRTVLGTLNNCAGGMTPWGTILTGEENFNQYFDINGDIDPRYAKSYERYGITGEDTRGWSQVDDRFELSGEPHEPFRFGYVVEVDVLSPGSTPKKRTMLGRMKHEGATCSISPDGRAVIYMGDDERGDYIYKFVSRDKYDDSGTPRARRHNLHLLNAGTLYVARFNGDGLDDGISDGRGVWLPLTTESESYVDGFSVAEVLIDTRLAADRVRPTRMDRPEDIERNPVNGKVYCALTNNSARGTTFPVDEPNPLGSSMIREELGGPLIRSDGNRNGYVLEISETRGDQEAETFRWDLFLVCGDPEAAETYFGGFPKDQVSPISCPDNVTFDREGNLWISTDGSSLGSNDGLFQVPVDGPGRGHVQQFLTVPIGAETCGPLIMNDNKTVFTAVQHPGELDGATFDNPGSTWPHTDPFPRPSVICTFRIDD